MTVRATRQRVGRETGIILTGVATAVSGTSINDTSPDSPFNAADNAELLNGAGVLIHVVATGVTHYRTNITYVPGPQGFLWAGSVASIAIGDSYEIHLEPLLNPLINWPDLIEDALKTIKRISWQEILMNGRGYYDLTDYTDIDGPEQVRRLYDTGPNLLKNGDLALWPTGAAMPTNWTLFAGTAPTRAEVRNYPHGMQNTAAGLLQTRQSVSMSGPGRLRGTFFTKYISGTSIRFVAELTALLPDASVERTAGVTRTVTTGGLTDAVPLRTELEITHRTASVLMRVEIDNCSTCSGVMWAPTLTRVSDGQARRIQPLTPMLYDDTVRLYVPESETVGRMALLLPYSTVADDGATVISTSLNDNLLIAAVAVQVLRWLISNPQLPDKSQFQFMLAIWEAKFAKRHREHMRKIMKTPQMWEAGELTGPYYGYEVGGRR